MVMMGVHDIFSQRVDLVQVKIGAEQQGIPSVLRRRIAWPVSPWLPVQVFVKTEPSEMLGYWWEAGLHICVPGSMPSSPTGVCSYLSLGFPRSGEVFSSFSVYVLRPQLLGAVRYVLIANLSLKLNIAPALCT